MKTCSRCRWVLWLAVLAQPGCGGRGVEQVKVTGKVTLDGGRMPGPGTLFFSPLEPAPGQPRRPGTAEFGPDGAYAAGAFERGDGLVPGRYAVAVHCWKVAATREDRNDAVSFIPQKYTDPQTSGLQLVVVPGARAMTKDFALASGE